MKYASLIIVLFVLASVQVHASFNVAYTVEENIIREQGTALFTFIVDNTGETTDRYRVLFNDGDWSIRSSPAYYYFSGFEVSPDTRQRFTIALTPSDGIPYNLYLLNVQVQSERSGETKLVSLPVEYRPLNYDPGIYRTAVRWQISVPDGIDPRNDIPLVVTITNRNPKSLAAFSVSTESPYFSDLKTFPLSPLGEERIQFSFPLDPLLQPGTFNVSFKFTADGEELLPIEVRQVRIRAYEQIDTTEKTQRGFFRIKTAYTYTNAANADTVLIGSERITLFNRIFTSLLIDDQRMSRTFVSNQTGTFLTWEAPLEMGSTRTVTILMNFMALFWLLLISVVCVLAYFLLRSPVQIKKDAVVVGVTEGGISEIRIVIHVRNLSKNRYKDITVIDSLPKLAEFVPEKEDSYNATRVYRNEKEGSIIKWNLDSLERYEERIFTYRVRSKLSIVGGLNLPRTIIRFSDESGSEQVSRSNAHKIRL